MEWSSSPFPPAVDLAFRARSATANAMYIFGAISLKTKRSLSECKRLGLYSRLHHFASILQNSRGCPPPTYRRADPSSTLPYSAHRTSRKPPGLTSGSATGMLKKTSIQHIYHRICHYLTFNSAMPTELKVR